MATRVSSPVLIGRSVEFERLRAALRGAREGRSSAIVVAGEAGVGKTRLVSDFADFADRDGAVVLSGGCIVLGDGSLPYAPVVEALRGLVRRLSPDELDAIVGNGRADLARLVPDLGPAADEDGSGLDSSSAQGRLFEMLLGVLDRLAAMAPVVFIVEDLHWSDRSTRDLVGFLDPEPARRPRHARPDLPVRRAAPAPPAPAVPRRAGAVGPGRATGARPVRPGASAAQQLRGDRGARPRRRPRRIDPRPIGRQRLLRRGAAGRDERRTRRRAAVDPPRPAAGAGHRAGRARPRSSCASRPRPASGSTRRCSPRPRTSTRRRSTTRSANASNRQVLIPDPTAGRRALRLPPRPAPGGGLRRPAARGADATPRGVRADARGERGRRCDPRGRARLPLVCRARPAARARVRGRRRRRRRTPATPSPRRSPSTSAPSSFGARSPTPRPGSGTTASSSCARAAGVARFHDAARAVALIQTAIKLVDETADPARASLLNERLGRCAWIAGQGEVAREAYRAAMRLIPPEPPSVARARAMAGLAQILMLGARFEESRTWANDALAAARAVGARDVEGHALNTRGHRPRHARRDRTRRSRTCASRSRSPRRSAASTTSAARTPTSSSSSMSRAGWRTPSRRRGSVFARRNGSV